MSQIYTIGYATKPIETYLAQLKKYQINVVADVRSAPYSKAFFDYHQEVLVGFLKQENIQYVYLGDELGPRSKVSAHYDEAGQVQFQHLMRSPLFITGIERLQKGLNKGYRIALTYAEKDAAICHRSLLIGYELEREYGVSVQHICHKGDIESQQSLEKRLMVLTNTKADMFADEKTCLDLAYSVQVKRYAYMRP